MQDAWRMYHIIFVNKQYPEGNAIGYTSTSQATYRIYLKPAF